MSRHERAEFRAFCQQATDTQLLNILEKERKAAESGDPYREICAAIAETVAESRGLWGLW